MFDEFKDMFYLIYLSFVDVFIYVQGFVLNLHSF